MPDEHQRVPNQDQLALREVGQARTDFAAIQDDLEFLLQRITRLPTAPDLWRVAMLIAFVSAALGIVGIKAFWRYFPCAPV
jgi:hypothetical protein